MAQSDRNESPLDLEGAYQLMGSLFEARFLQLCRDCDVMGDGKSKASLLTRKACKLVVCGNPTDEEFEKGYDLYEAAAQMGSVEANYFIGVTNADLDPEYALEHLERAAKSGHAEAQFQYAKLLQSQTNYPEEMAQLSQAVQWYEKAAAFGDLEHLGAYGVALYLLSLIDEKESTSRKAITVLRSAGHRGSMNAHDFMIVQDVVFEKDLKLFRERAANGDQRFFYVSGWMYDTGSGGVKKDLEKAKYFYERGLRAGIIMCGGGLVSILSDE